MGMTAEELRECMPEVRERRPKKDVLPGAERSTYDVLIDVAAFVTTGGTLAFLLIGAIFLFIDSYEGEGSPKQIALRAGLPPPY